MMLTYDPLTMPRVNVYPLWTERGADEVDQYNILEDEEEFGEEA